MHLQGCHISGSSIERKISRIALLTQCFFFSKYRITRHGISGHVSHVNAVLVKFVALKPSVQRLSVDLMKILSFRKVNVVQSVLKAQASCLTSSVVLTPCFYPKNFRLNSVFLVNFQAFVPCLVIRIIKHSMESSSASKAPANINSRLIAWITRFQSVWLMMREKRNILAGPRRSRLKWRISKSTWAKSFAWK